MTPLCGRAEFDQVVRDLARRQVPRRFAVVQEWGDRVDARVAAWGLEHETRADVVSAEGDAFFVVGSADAAAAILGTGEDVSAHVVWFDESMPTDPRSAESP